MSRRLIAIVMLGCVGCSGVDREGSPELATGLADQVWSRDATASASQLRPTQTLMVLAGAETTLSYPIASDGTIRIPARVEGFGSVAGTRVDFALDTGGNFVVELDARDARRLGAWISEDVVGAVGPAGEGQAFAGALGAVEVGPIRLGPAFTMVLCPPNRQSPLLGEGFIESALAGVVVDPRAGVCTLIVPSPGRDAPRVPEGWVSIPWTRESLSGEPEERAGLRTVPVAIGDRTYRAVLDTGLSPGCFAFVDVETRGPSERVRIVGHGESRLAREAQLADTLSIGSLRLERVAVWSPVNGVKSDGVAPSFDLVIGLGTLGDTPVWFDPVSGEVRLWIRSGPARLD